MTWLRRRSAAITPPAPPLGPMLRDGRSGSIISTSLTESDRRDLYSLMQMPGYKVLLDVMELACIQQETALVNCPADDEVSVLAAHKLSKARWEFFVWVQKKIQYEVAEAMQPAAPPPDPEQQEIAAILDPTRSY